MAQNGRSCEGSRYETETCTMEPCTNDDKISSSTEQSNTKSTTIKTDFDEMTMLFISVGVAGIDFAIGLVVFFLLKYYYKGKNCERYQHCYSY